MAQLLQNPNSLKKDAMRYNNFESAAPIQFLRYNKKPCKLKIYRVPKNHKKTGRNTKKNIEKSRKNKNKQDIPRNNSAYKRH